MDLVTFEIFISSLIAAVGGGVLTGVLCYGKVRSDIDWIKRDLEKIEDNINRMWEFINDKNKN